MSALGVAAGDRPFLPPILYKDDGSHGRHSMEEVRARGDVGPMPPDPGMAWYLDIDVISGTNTARGATDESPMLPKRLRSAFDPAVPDVGDDTNVLMKKVVSGIQRLSEQQMRLEEAVLESLRRSRMAGRNPGSAGGTPVKADSAPYIGSSAFLPQPSRNNSLVLGAGTFSPTADDPMAESITFSGELQSTWPASIAARYPPAMELAQEDDKLVLAISKMGLARGLSNFGKQNSSRQLSHWFHLPVVHPSSNKVQCFDLLGCFVLLHDICVTPYVLAWHTTVEGWWLLTAYLAWMFWCADSAAGFCMAYYKGGELQQTQPEIAFRYLKRHFTVDMVLVTADILNLLVDTNLALGLMLFKENTRVLRVLKLTRLLKLARAARVARLIDRIWLSDSKAPASSSAFVAALVFKILVITIISNHLLACLWFWQGSSGPSDTSRSWLEESGVISADPIYQYFTSLHWSVGQMTLGASDVMPANSYERFLNIAFLLNGLVFGSTTVSYVSAAIVDYIMIKRDATNQLLECRKFLRQYMVPQKLAAQVVKQVSKRLAEEVPLKESDVTALKLLAPTLQTQVQQSTRTPHLQQHALLNIWSEVERRCLEALSARAVGHQFLSREDDLFCPHLKTDKAWLVLVGELQYLQTPSTSNVMEEEVSLVGPGTWVCEAALWSYWATVGYMEAHDKSCHLLHINADCCFQVLMDYPTIQRLTQQYAKNFHACITSAGPPHSDWPTDLHIPFTEDVAMLLSQQVGLGLLKRGLAQGSLELTEEDEAYVTKELLGGKCTIQYSDDGSQLERVVALANVMLMWNGASDGDSILGGAKTSAGASTNGSSVSPGLEQRRSSGMGSASMSSAAGAGEMKVLYQIGSIDEKGKKKLALHMPGTKRWTGESPQLALQRILDEDLKFFAKNMVVRDSERKVSVKDSTQSVKMRTKTVKTVYRSLLLSVPQGLTATTVEFPKLSGLEDLPPHDLLTLPKKKSVDIYCFMLPDKYEIIDLNENRDAMKEWISTLPLDYTVV